MSPAYEIHELIENKYFLSHILRQYYNSREYLKVYVDIR